MKNKLFSASFLLFSFFVLFFIPITSFAHTNADVDPGDTSSCISISNNLRQKSRDISTNGEVSKLQKFLHIKGYLSSEPTGYFGLLTLKAVKDFQSANGIDSTGFVGPLTKAKINAMCGVSDLQKPDVSVDTARLESLNKNIKDLGAQYAKASLSTKSTLSKNISDSLKERKLEMSELAEKNPKEFLDKVLSTKERDSLPAQVRTDVESYTTITSKVDVYHIDDFKNNKFSYKYILNKNGKNVNFYSTMDDPGLISGAEIKVSGYFLDNVFVANTKVDVSVAGLTPESELDSIGDQNTLVLLVNLADSPPPLITAQDANNLIFGDINKFFKEASYNKTFLSGKILGWTTLPVSNTRCTYSSYDFFPGGQLFNEAIAQFPNIDLNGVDRLFIIANNPSCMTGGYSTVGKTARINVNGSTYSPSFAFMATTQSSPFNYPAYNVEIPNLTYSWNSFDFLFSHEMGHSLGVRHANNWTCESGESLYGKNCYHEEYRNNFDVMGTGSYSLHFNGYYKERLGWLKESDGSILNINKSGEYRLNPIETNIGYRAAKIQIGNETPFYLEYRRGVGFDSNLNSTKYFDLPTNQNGLFINWIPNGEIFPRLLDASPVYINSNDFSQVTLNQGIFEDKVRKIAIGPITKINNDEIYFKVNLLTNLIPINYIPVITGTSILPGEIKPGQSVPFSWYATDADNEDLFWQIDWGDGILKNETCSVANTKSQKKWTFTEYHSWAKPGTYYVKALANDCNGSTSVESVFVLEVRDTKVYNPDINNDGTIDYNDTVALGIYFKNTPPMCPNDNSCDVDSNGKFDIKDTTIYLSTLLYRYDMNTDGKINKLDYEFMGQVVSGALACPIASCDFDKNGSLTIADWTQYGLIAATFPDYNTTTITTPTSKFSITLQPNGPVQAGGGLNIAWNFKDIDATYFKIELVSSASTTGSGKYLATYITSGSSYCKFIEDTFQCAYTAIIPVGTVPGNYYLRITEDSTRTTINTNDVVLAISS